MNKQNRLRRVLLIQLVLLFSGQDAWALQSHGAPEGIYVHQMAHVLFIGALGYLFWHTRATQDRNHRGWRWLQVFCVLMVSWNMLAFAGHETFGLLGTDDFIDRNTIHEQLAHPVDMVKMLYFVTKMDHLFFLPSLMALTLSLRHFYRRAMQGETR